MGPPLNLSLDFASAQSESLRIELFGNPCTPVTEVIGFQGAFLRCTCHATHAIIVLRLPTRRFVKMAASTDTVVQAMVTEAK